MRKKLWGCAAAAVAAAGVSCLTAYYAWEHPNSWLGRCLFTAHHVATSEAVAVTTPGNVARVAFHGMQGLLGTVAPAAAAACEEAGPCGDHAAPAAEDVEVMEPAVLPGVVVIPEDDVLPARPLPPVHDLVGALPDLGGAEEGEEFPMPRAEDGAAKMPLVPAEDDDCCRPAVKKSGPEKGDPGVMPGCKEADRCPDASGCPHPGGGRCVPRTIKGREGHSGNEECEPVFPKMRRDGGEKPTHPDVDTMEVRPSDLWFLNFMGPF